MKLVILALCLTGCAAPSMQVLDCEPSTGQCFSASRTFLETYVALYEDRELIKRQLSSCEKAYEHRTGAAADARVR